MYASVLHSLQNNCNMQDVSLCKNNVSSLIYHALLLREIFGKIASIYSFLSYHLILRKSSYEKFLFQSLTQCRYNKPRVAMKKQKVLIPMQDLIN